MKGSGSYTDTYNVIAYSLVPYAILSIVPLIGFLSFIYSIILMTIGFAKYHNISKGKAVTAAIIPLVIVLVLLIILAIFIFFSLSRSFRIL